MQWKVLVIDEAAKKIIDNVVKEDDILNENIASKLHMEIHRDELRMSKISRGLRIRGR